MSKFKLIFLFQENVTYFLKLHDRNDNDRNMIMIIIIIICVVKIGCCIITSNAFQ